MHGRTKAERAHDALQKKKLEANVEQAKLEQAPKSESDDERGSEDS